MYRLHRDFSMPKFEPYYPSILVVVFVLDMRFFCKVLRIQDISSYSIICLVVSRIQARGRCLKMCIYLSWRQMVRPWIYWHPKKQRFGSANASWSLTSVPTVVLPGAATRALPLTCRRMHVCPVSWKDPGWLVF